MKQILALLVCVIVASVSCKKDKAVFKTGVYTETTPIPGRCQLNFINSRLIVKSETGSNYKDTFTYIISPRKILLKPTWTSQYGGQQFDFEEIDESTFKIEKLYPGIPELPKSYMTFKK